MRFRNSGTGLHSCLARLKTCATFVLLALTVGACAHRTLPASPARPAPPALSPALIALQHDIDATLSQPQLSRGYWGVLVKSLWTDETLFALNAGKLMLPASNMKIVTVAAAADTLGWDYRYETKVLTAGPIEGGTLQGDLIVVGSGDPSLVAADGMADRVFADWADRLKQRGIRTIAGRVIGDDDGFEKETLGFGWSWDDLQDDYAAGVGALQFNENAVKVAVTPGPSIGDFAGASISPAGSGLTIVSSVITRAAGSPTSITTHRLPGRMTLELRGTIAIGASPILAVSVDNPTLFFATALRTALIGNGIDVRGPAMDIDDVRDVPPVARMTPVVSYQSAPLSTLAVRLMKVSQNQYAETFLKTLGAGPGVAPTAAGGRNAVLKIVAGWGVSASDVIQRDGSGLSRYDYVTPEALVAILTHVDRDARLKGPFEASLPIAGQLGLSNRMKGTLAEGNARAKTGSMTAVRGLAGYVTSADGEPLVFSILANNFDSPAATINSATDAIVVRLAAFKR